jgi:hypothetical protein
MACVHFLTIQLFVQRLLVNEIVVAHLKQKLQMIVVFVEMMIVLV